MATIIFLINGKLVLLRPRRAVHEEVKYDLQVLADRIEFYWTHLSGIGTLENSLWGWDGKQIRIWLDALTIEKIKLDETKDVYESVTESVAIPIDFYPLGEFTILIFSSNRIHLTGSIGCCSCSYGQRYRRWSGSGNFA